MPISSSRSSNFYKRILSQGIDSAIQGATVNDASQLLFSTANPNNGISPVYTRSTTCWAKNIDTSPTSVWTDGNGGNPRYNANMMTLISPRHGVVANHWGGQIPGANWDNYIGAKFIFVAMDNTCYIRTFTGSTRVGTTDIRVVLLDSDLPPNISFCKVASSSLASVAISSNRIPAMFQSYFPLNLQPGLRAAIADYYEGTVVTPDNATRASFYVTPWEGDSGRPICFVYNNKLILLLTFTSTTSGPNFPDYIEQINSAMTALGGGYTLSIFNKEDIISQEKNISIKKQNATFLKPYSINGGTNEYDPNAVYIFKGGSINTVSTVFNYLELQGASSYSTADGIYIPSLGSYIYYKNSGIGGTGWRTTGGVDATNLVINDNDLIYFTPRSYKQISVGSGAIIQRYSNGKISLKKSNLSKLISTGSFIFVRGSNNTIGTFSNGSEFVNSNNQALADLISIKSPGEGIFTSYYFRADGINWRRSGSSESQNNTVILDGSIIVYTTYNSVLKEFTVQGNNIVRVN